MAAQLPAGGTVLLSFGETAKDEYVMQLAADHLVHGWDLAVATNGDTRMDPHLVHAVSVWFSEREGGYRDAGAISARRQLAGDAQHDLLARFGRDAGWGPHHQLLQRFNAAFGAGDVDAAMALVTDDVVFDATSPAPDGRRHEGRDAARAAWTEVMRTPGMTFIEEESFVTGDRAVVRWRYGWGDPEEGHVRGVDVSWPSATDWSARSCPTSRAEPRPSRSASSSGCTIYQVPPKSAESWQSTCHGSSWA